MRKKTKGAIKKAKTKTQEKKILTTQRNVLNNALKLYDKRSAMIDEFINKNIYFENLEEDGHQYEEPSYEESRAERTKMRRQNQAGKGLRILTPGQMLSRLPISLAQLQAENNSDRLKNEIRQPLYSFYRSKNYTKQSINI